MPRRSNGPRLRWLKKRNAFYIFWTEAGRSRECSTSTENRDEAEEFFGEWLRNRVDRSGPRRATQTLVTDILYDYGQERATLTMSAPRIGHALVVLGNFWTDRTVNEITARTCELYAHTRDRAPGTIRRELGVLRSAINYAFKNGRLTEKVYVHLPDQPPPKDRWLTRDEAAKLLRAARALPRARAYLPFFILLGLHTGRRKEAILSRRWVDVDLDAPRMNFEIKGRKITRKKRGIIRIPPRLLPILRARRRDKAELGYVVSSKGKQINDIKKSFETACTNAGLKDVCPHTLKHTCTTWLMQAGVDPWQVAGYLATSVDTILRTYGKHHPDYQKDAVEAIGRRPQNVRTKP